jgi:hypothetical protein
MTSSLAPLVAVGTLSGNLPTGAGAMTRGSSPLAAGSSPFNVVMLNESNAVTGVTFQPFAAPKVTDDGASAALAQQTLLLAQEQSQS